MNRLTKILPVIVFLAALVSTSAVAQQSDYEIQQNFRTEYSNLADRIDNAVSSDDLAGIQRDIEALESQYAGSSDLIDAAIYPDSFEDRIADLRSRFANTEQNISEIEALNERIEELNSDLQGFRNQLDEFEQRSDELENQLAESRSSEQRVSSLARQYRENLEERDKFVVGFLQDLLNRFENMDPETLSEIQDSDENLEENPLAVIQTIIAGYINRADQDSGLELADYLQMRAQHAYFEDVWEDIGDSLSEVFAADRQVQAEQEVADMLAAWKASVDNKLWGAFSTAFSQNGIDLSSFNDSESLYDSIISYVDAAMETSRQQNSEEDYEVYRSFNDFWNNRFKANWGDLIVEANVLDFSQISAIDLKLNDWNENAIPTSNLMMILLIVSVVVIIGLIVMLVTKKG